MGAAEVAGGAGHGHGDRDVAVITPWYPTRQVPFGGAFVRAMVEATAPVWTRATVYHVDGWGARVSVPQDEAILRASPGLVTRTTGAATTVAGAELRYVAAPARVGISFAQLARRHSDALRTALGGQKIGASVVHGHVGLRGGWTALENARPGARVFVTEHASFLRSVLEQPDSRAMYDEVIRRATGFFAVGESVRSVLVETFPHHADRITIMPNPISFGPAREHPVADLRRWLYVGVLKEPKGVGLLLEAFARCRAEDPSLTLTFVGEGALRGPLGLRVAELGVADAVTFAGWAEHDRALELMRQHDLLVHPSRSETFGMVVVEAISAGAPVLVTRCGGPEVTLAGIEDAAGALMDVTDDPGTIVDAYRALRDRFPSQVDVAHARTVLEDRYGYDAIGQAYARAWFPDVVDAGSAADSRHAASSPLE